MALLRSVGSACVWSWMSVALSGVSLDCCTVAGSVQNKEALQEED